MATKYISDLPSANTIANDNYIVIDDGSTNYKVTFAVMKSLLATVASFTVNNEAGTITLTTTTGTTFTITPHDPTKQNTLTFDDTPTENSTNPVTSDGIFDALALKFNTADYVNFTGATDSEAGTAGRVPAPSEPGLYLSSSGAWQTPDTTPTADSNVLVTSGGVKEAIDNIEIEVDSALDDDSTNPVQNKVISAMMKSTAESDSDYHMGFYIDADGDLCQA